MNDASSSGRIAYLVTIYPKVSHSFIRREIRSLEQRGLQVLRIAMRGWDGELVDPDDLEERARTRYLLRDGLAALLWAVLRAALRSPLRFTSAFALAVRMSQGGERSLAYHLAYLAEACRALPWLASFGATHVHAHFGTNSTEIAMLVHQLGGPPYSFTAHGPEEFDKPQFISLGEKVRRSAFVVAISSFGASQLRRWVEHEHWRKIHVVHCGLEPAFHEGNLPAPPAAPRLVCVGRLCEQKGQLLLLEAAQCLVAAGVDFELVFVGDGEMRPQIERLIAEFGLSGRVRITGWISSDAVRSEILAARALVLPSFAEGLPVVLMEAMALRRPVLTTCIAGIPELVRPGENGWLVPAGAVAELTDAMREVLGLAPSELARLGDAARRRVLERHSVDVEATKLVALFRRHGLVVGG
jgi:colanic acid/amylovoran biosynthesis glycosyltransferase